MSQEEIFINGELLRLRREARGWAQSDLATRACMSVKQIRQLEDGGLNSFYSQAVKVTAAKKVGALLGVSAEEVLAQAPLVDATPLVDVSADATADESHAVDHPQDTQTEEVNVDDKSHDVVSADAQQEVALKHDAEKAEPAKSKTSLWVIVGLFAAALAVAAYMQPKEEPISEPAPPLQVVPSEADASASAAEPGSSSPAAVASAESASSASQKAASASVSSASVAASAPRASTPISTAPAASAASSVKAP
jgi:transcriptional regulator with XRE-family HTH domain